MIICIIVWTPVGFIFFNNLSIFLLNVNNIRPHVDYTSHHIDFIPPIGDLSIVTVVLTFSTSVINVWIQAGPVVAMKVTRRRGLIPFLAKVERVSSGRRCRGRPYIFVTFLIFLYSGHPQYFLGNIALGDREVGRSFDPVLVWKSNAGDSKGGIVFLSHLVCCWSYTLLRYHSGEEVYSDYFCCSLREQTTQ